MTDDVSVAIVDDHPAFLEGLRQIVTGAPGMRLVGLARTSAGIVDLAAQCQPAVVVLDIGMPDVSGISAIEQILRVSPTTGILILSTFDREEYVLSAVRAGARGYLVKTAAVADIVQAIGAIGAGQMIFGVGIAEQITEHFLAPAASRPPFPGLTTREREVLTLLVRGHRNLDIARALHITTKTVRNYLSRIFTELGASDRTDAIRLGREAGLS